MAQKTKVQEIVVVSASHFAGRAYVQKTKNTADQHPSLQTPLKDACWNGMLKDILPELFVHFSREEQLFLWQLRECRNTFTVELSEKPGDLDLQSSIDPYCFLEFQEYN